jgi:hypothetical protein
MRDCDNFFETIKETSIAEPKDSFNLPWIIHEYRDYLPSEDKEYLNNLITKKKLKSHLLIKQR